MNFTQKSTRNVHQRFKHLLEVKSTLKLTIIRDAYEAEKFGVFFYLHPPFPSVNISIELWFLW